MLFQVIDTNEECFGFYSENKFHFDKHIPQNLTRTWNYSKHLESHNCEIGYVWSKGKKLSDACPDYLKEDFEKNIKKMKAFYKSLKTAKINAGDFCLFDLVPHSFLKDFCKIKNQITDHVISTYEKPLNYDFMLEVVKMVEDIKSQSVSFDKEALRPFLSKQGVRNLWKRIGLFGSQIAYNPYGTVTGRLSVQPGSFPILNMAREARVAILPKNDCFIELDFNAAELRVLLALSEKEQPDIDIHEWNAKNLFKQDLSRDEIKKKTFSWLYNPKAVDKSLEMCYNKNHVLQKHFNGCEIETVFNRKIKSDDHHALNYIIQSTTSDLFLKQAIKIWKLLKGKKSNVAFTIHDSLVIDFDLSDKKMVRGLVDEFSNTEFGNFKVNISGGKNFGNMKEMKI